MGKGERNWTIGGRRCSPALFLHSEPALTSSFRGALGLLAALLSLTPLRAVAQGATDSVAVDKRWSIATSLFAYLEAGNETFFTPILYADRGSLHLEGRYNYEAEHTGSVWAGLTFETGTKLTLTATPMVGVVFGDFSGFGPGIEFTLSLGRLQLYNESEWVIDPDNSSESFFFMWSQLTYGATEPLRVGLVTQRTKLYETDLDVQIGPMAAVQAGKVELFGAAMNPWGDDAFAIVAVSVAW